MIKINQFKVGPETEETIKTAINLYKMELEKKLVITENIFLNRSLYNANTVAIISDEIMHIKSKVKILDSLIDLFKEE